MWKLLCFRNNGRWLRLASSVGLVGCDLPAQANGKWTRLGLRAQQQSSEQGWVQGTDRADPSPIVGHSTPGQELKLCMSGRQWHRERHSGHHFMRRKSQDQTAARAVCAVDRPLR